MDYEVGGVRPTGNQRKKSVVVEKDCQTIQYYEYERKMLWNARNDES